MFFEIVQHFTRLLEAPAPGEPRRWANTKGRPEQVLGRTLNSEKGTRDCKSKCLNQPESSIKQRPATFSLISWVIKQPMSRIKQFLSDVLDAVITDPFGAILNIVVVMALIVIFIFVIVLPWGIVSYYVLFEGALGAFLLLIGGIFIFGLLCMIPLVIFHSVLTGIGIDIEFEKVPEFLFFILFAGGTLYLIFSNVVAPIISGSFHFGIEFIDTLLKAIGPKSSFSYYIKLIGNIIAVIAGCVGLYYRIKKKKQTSANG